VFATIEQRLVSRELGSLLSSDEAMLGQALTETIG
jgi:hypothetical protein